jgi:hypothetical protein
MEAWLEERVAAARKEPVTEVVTLTPVLAELLLERNEGRGSEDHNRPISATMVDRLKRDIEGGRWEFNGEAIVVSKDGKLNDGQHRCKAVVETGRSIRTILVVGPERKSRMTLDTGVGRTTGHFLRMNGYVDTNNLAAMAALVWRHKEKGRIAVGSNDQPTKAEVLMTVEGYKDFPDSLLYVSKANNGVVASKSVLGFAHWTIWKKAGLHVANEFMDGLLDGIDLSKTSPILYCRNRLMEARVYNGQMKMTVGAKVELILRAYNLWRRKDTAARIPLNGRLPELEA